jgi:hypothetical protein
MQLTCGILAQACLTQLFECSRIIGRRFEDIGDHASYLRDGGCSEIIDALATT